jgi:hypothetical protein
MSTNQITSDKFLFHNNTSASAQFLRAKIQ